MPPTEPGGSTRLTPRWLIAIAGLLLVARVGLGVWEARNPDRRPDHVEWTSPSAAVAAARAAGRPILYVFLDRADPASRRLAAEVFTQSEMAEQINRRFVPVRIEGPPGRDTPETSALRRRFGVTTLPAMVVTTHDGAKSKTIAGYRGAIPTLEQVLVAQVEVLDLPLPRRGGPLLRIERTPADSAAAPH